MSVLMKLSLVEARRLAVLSQRLAGTRAPATAAGLMEIARAIRCIQIDAVGVVGAPTQLLVPFSRVGPYEARLLDRLQFEDRTLFHYFAHAASLVLTEDFAIHSARMVPYSSRTTNWAKGIAAWMVENAALREQIIGEITARGPLRSRDFENTARTDWRSSGWTQGRSVNRMLDFLWVEGILTVSGRAGAEKLWDLSERWFPAWTPRKPLAPDERADLAVELALRALGPATPQQIQFHFIRGSHPDLAGSLARLTRSGAVLPVDVAALKGAWHVHRDTLALLEERWRPRTVLLSPFDNLIADRRRTALLFGFDYTIEIYVPAAKRKRGYYAMPILAGDRLAGTVDPRYERASRRLIVNRVAFEAGEKMKPAITRAIADLAKFVGAREVVPAC
jgi:uncharacterized protein YcaQ